MSTAGAGRRVLAMGGVGAAILVAWAPCGAAYAQTASVSAWEAADFRSWSFIPNWTSQSQVNSFRGDRIYDHVSDVLYSFGVQPRANGSLYYRPEAANHLARLKSDQEMFGFRYHMCMFTVNGGDTDDVWESITGSPSIRATFTGNVKNLMLANNMTGFNLDWESPNSASEWGNYTQLAREMQSAFPAEWEVSVDSLGYADYEWNDSPLFDPLVFDQVGVMAYHYTASSQATWLNRLNTIGFDDSQLILGMGTWGQGGPATLPLKNLVAVDPNLPANATNWSGTAVDVNGVTRTGTWDIVSRYEVRDNVQLAMDRGLAGVMWWTLSYDATNKLSLARVAQHYAMFKRGVPDLNLDGKVDADDANDLADNMGTVPGWTGTNTAAQMEDFYLSGNWEQGDRDGDGFVNQADADWLAGRYAALGVALPDRLAYTGSFEKLAGSSLSDRWQAVRNAAGRLPETGNYAQHDAGAFLFSGSGPGANTFSASSVTIRNQNAAEAFESLNDEPRQMRGQLADAMDLGEQRETYFTFLVRQNTAALSAAQLTSPDRTLSLEMLDAAGQNQFDFTLFGEQTDFAIRNQADAAGQDVTADGFAADATYLFVGKISGNGAAANTMQAALFAPGSLVGNFTDPEFDWMLTAEGSAGFNPVITQIQFTSQFEGNFTVSDVVLGDADDFFGAPSPGDFNADGIVDAADLVRWRSGVGMAGAATHWDGDADGDRSVDGADFLIWQRRLGSAPAGGSTSAATGAVPEPTAAVMALTCVLGAIGLRRSRGRCLGPALAVLALAGLSLTTTPAAAAPQVRIGYVIPSDRTPQPSGVAHLQELMLSVQDWYGDQMQRWGFGYKTFDLEMMPDGVTPLVHVVDTSRTAATIRSDVWTQTYTAAQGAGLPIWSSGQVWLLSPESHMQNPNGSIAGKTALGGSNGSGLNGGLAVMESDLLFRASPDILTDTRNYGGLTFPELGPYPFVQGRSFHDFEGSTISSIASSVQGATAHELGHAFGLGHDFRNDDNFDGNHMGNGLRGWRGAQLPERFPSDDMYLSEAAALALNTSRYFNAAAPVTDQQLPTLSLSGASSVTIVDGQLRIPFVASDAGQLAAALLRRNVDGDEQVIAEMPLEGALARSAFTTPWYEPGQSNEFTISVYDVQGNRRDSSIDVTPPSGSNRAPQPAIDLSRSTVVVGDTVHFDASGSSDPENGPRMTFQWDLDGDGQFDLAPTQAKILQHQMLTPGDFRITARLTDPDGASSISAALMLRVVQQSDFDYDGDVDGRDLVACGEGFGTGLVAEHSGGDADGDRDVDGRDFLFWQRQLGGGAAVAAEVHGVPEPAAISLSLLAVCAGWTSHRRLAARRWASRT